MGDRTPQALWHRNRARAVTDGVRRISDLPEGEAAAELRACCASPRWVERMLSQRPFKDADEVFESAERIWWDLPREEWLAAFQSQLAQASCDDPEAELRPAAKEQAEITRLRLVKLLEIGS
jgi:hypothetical protein